ncbi:hypothetical protein J6I39_06130, partial [bacterium]|nr:hypothetical protein [bacterium]
TGYSPSLISDYNEYNAEVTILNDNNISCRYSKYENNCYKFAGPKKCSYSSSCTQARVSFTCNSAGCIHSYCTTQAFPNLNQLGNATYWCSGPNGTVYGGSVSNQTGFSINVCANKAGCRNDGTPCVLKYTSCGVTGTNAQVTYSSPQSSCSAVYYP